MIVSIAGTVIPNWQDTRSCELWIWLETPFMASDGTQLQSASPLTGDKIAVRKIACTVDTSAKTLTIPSASDFYSTTDGLDTTVATYSSAFFTPNGTPIKETGFESFDSFRLPAVPALNWEIIRNFNFTSVQSTDTSVYTKNQSLATFALIDSVIPDTRRLTATSPLLIDGGASADLSVDRTLSIPRATGTADGYLAAADFAVFNAKQAPLGITVDGVQYATIQAAHDALPAWGGLIIVPASLTAYAGATISKSNVWLRGAGARATVISTASATGDIITVTGSWVFIEDLTISSSVTRTAGAGINWNGTQYGGYRNVEFANQFNSVVIQGANATEIHGKRFRVSDTAANGVGVLVQGGTDHSVSYMSMDTSLGTQPRAGVELTHCGGCRLANSSLIRAGTGVLIDPANTKTVSDVTINHFRTDTCISYGIDINPAAGGTVARVKIIDSPTNSNTLHGVYIRGAGTVVDISLLTQESVNNGRGGIYVETGSIISINGAVVSGNSTSASGTWDGINFAANLNDFSVVNSTSEQTGSFPNSQRYGLNVQAGTSTRYTVVNNNFTTNATGSFNDGGTGNNRFRANNLETSPRMLADFTDATVRNRYLFVTSEVNQLTSVGVIPSGSSQQAYLNVFNDSGATNASAFTHGITDAAAVLDSGHIGSGATLPISLRIDSVEKAQLTTAGNLVLGSGALATNATDGFPHWPSTAGAPTGVPTAFSGRVPEVYDTVNDRVYKYNAGWQLVAGKQPFARVYNDADIGISNNTLTVITLNSERNDTDGIHSTSSNTSWLVAPVPGVYVITGHVIFASNATGYRLARILLNGTTPIGHINTNANASDVTALTVTATYYLAANDRVELQVLHTAGTTINVSYLPAQSPEFSIVRISN